MRNITQGYKKLPWCIILRHIYDVDHLDPVCTETARKSDQGTKIIYFSGILILSHS